MPNVRLRLKAAVVPHKFNSRIYEDNVIEFKKNQNPTFQIDLPPNKLQRLEKGEVELTIKSKALNEEKPRNFREYSTQLETKSKSYSKSESESIISAKNQFQCNIVSNNYLDTVGIHFMANFK